ncbi:metallophosphoesterase [Marinisporobacter balticus]|uniref:metallophosphoesterase n=1 Tax=Marinisporobacter balticus TaxID=2018667 RepID=UPI001FAA0B07|nr:metallophosphoesterase [Marinisporobacter balticus]
MVMSDTHGRIEVAQDIMAEMNEIDLLIHLGDHYEDAIFLGKYMNIKVAAVKGNCDREEALKEIILELERHKLFLVHGHQYGVKMSLNKIYYKALELGCDIVLFGHTHMAVNIKHDGVLLMNPGSLSLPRDGSRASYGIIEIEGENVISSIIEV